MNANSIYKKTIYNIRPDILVCLFLVIATLVVYGQVRNYEFVGFDDDLFIIQNPRVRSGLTLESIKWAFSYDNITYWHPLTWLSYMMDVQLYGMNPGGHHMTNVLIHIVNAVLLFVALNKMTGALWKSAFVASLFTLHPLNVESVAWVVERKNVLSTMFWMLTMLTYAFYIERPGLYRYLLTLLVFMLGLLAKPMLVTLPFILLLMDYWPFGRLDPSMNHLSSPSFIYSKTTVFRLILEKFPFFILSGISVYLSFLSVQHLELVYGVESKTIYLRIANALVSYVNYIGKMIWPGNLAVFYPYPDMMPIWKVLGAFLFLISATVPVILTLKKRPYIAVGWFWYLGTLIPVIGLVQAGLWPAMADRFAYIPLIGLFVIVAWGVPDLVSGWNHKRVGLTASTAALFLILMITSWFQVSYWKNSVTLFKHAIEETTDNHVMHGNLGFALTARSRPDEAIKHFKESLRINPDDENAHLNLGIALLSQGKLDECVDYYYQVLRANPGYTKVHNNLGIVLLRQGKTEKAIAHFRESLRIKFDYADAHNSLGVALAFKGRIEEAVAHFKEALRIKPDYAIAKKNLAKYLPPGKNK